MRTALYSQIRGLLKTFGVVLAPGKGGSFARLVLRGVPEDRYVTIVIDSLLATWRHMSTELKKFNREIARAARELPACRRLMTVPGVGSLTSVAFATTVDKLDRFRRSKDLGPHFGLTPRQYQSGEVDRTGSISKCGDRMTRSLLFEAAGVLLFRNKQASALKEWGLRLSRRAGTRKARAAVARKLAILLHQLWTKGCGFLALKWTRALPAGVTRVLDAIVAERGQPLAIRCENGLELTNRHFLAWCVERQIELVHIQAGKPTQNAHIESFHGRLRERG